jgi:hypothetical protein
MHFQASPEVTKAKLDRGALSGKSLQTTPARIKASAVNAMPARSMSRGGLIAVQLRVAERFHDGPMHNSRSAPGLLDHFVNSLVLSVAVRTRLVAWAYSKVVVSNHKPTRKQICCNQAASSHNLGNLLQRGPSGDCKFRLEPLVIDRDASLHRHRHHPTANSIMVSITDCNNICQEIGRRSSVRQRPKSND